jgi:ABC-type sugar transport system ATPase subunit
VRQFADPDTVYRYPANLFVARFMGSPPMNTMTACFISEGGGPVVSGTPPHGCRPTIISSSCTKRLLRSVRVRGFEPSPTTT